MRRTAVLSDIHGNAVALRAVLAEIDAEGIDDAVCLGDVCQGGPEPGECVDLLLERGWPVVLGNADAFVLDASTGEDAEAVTERQLAVRAWSFERLTPAQRTAIAAYAPTVTHELGDGRAVVACHATPTSYEMVVFPNAPEDEYRAAFDGTGADVVACGHIHLQYLRRIGRTVVLNPGSVGLSYDHEQDLEHVRFDPWGAWAVIGVEDGRLSLEFRRTPFDAETVAEAHRMSSMPHADEYAAAWTSA